MGAINDRLRGLDRSGRPCKRWTKTGITLKSFTGVAWSIPTWSKQNGMQQQQYNHHGLSVQQQQGGSMSASVEPEGRTPEIMVHQYHHEAAPMGGLVAPGIIV